MSKIDKDFIADEDGISGADKDSAFRVNKKDIFQPYRPDGLESALGALAEEKVEYVAEKLKASETGKALLDSALANGTRFMPDVQMAMSGALAYYNPEKKVIGFNPMLPRDLLVSVLAHELRHAWQDQKGKWFNINLHPRDEMALLRMLEADAEAVAVRVTYEIADLTNKKERGALLNHLVDPSYHDQGYAFLHAVESANLKSAKAAHKAPKGKDGDKCTHPHPKGTKDPHHDECPRGKKAPPLECPRDKDADPHHGKGDGNPPAANDDKKARLIAQAREELSAGGRSEDEIKSFIGKLEQKIELMESMGGELVDMDGRVVMRMPGAGDGPKAGGEGFPADAREITPELKAELEQKIREKLKGAGASDAEIAQSLENLKEQIEAAEAKGGRVALRGGSILIIVPKTAPKIASDDADILNKGTRAAFDEWFSSEGRQRIYDRQIQSALQRNMFFYRGQAEELKEEGTGFTRLDHNLVQRMGELPDGSNYLYGTSDLSLESDWYRGGLTQDQDKWLARVESFVGSYEDTVKKGPNPPMNPPRRHKPRGADAKPAIEPISGDPGRHPDFPGESVKPAGVGPKPITRKPTFDLPPQAPLDESLRSQYAEEARRTAKAYRLVA